jgi:hypothetical protein
VNSKRDTQSDMLSADQFDLQTLRQVIRSESDQLSKPLALALLGKKDYPEKLADFQHVLTNEQESPRSRHIAAIELGRIGTREAIGALRQGLAIRDSFVQRGIVSALQSAGETEAVDEMRQLAEAEGEAIPARWAETLLAFRLGDPNVRISFPERQRFLVIDPLQAQAISFEPVRSDVATAAARDVADQSLGVPFSTAMAARTEIAGRSIMFLPSDEVAEPAGVERLLLRSSIVGVVGARYDLESETWSVAYYVLTQPVDDDDAVQVMLTTSTGEVAFAGEARVSGERTDFVLQAVEQPGAVPIEIRGSYERGRLRFEQALTELTRTGLPAPAPRTR